MNADEYIAYLTRNFLFKDMVTVVRSKVNKGFYTHWGMSYSIMVPDKKFEDIWFFTVMSLRHEVGHVIFHDLYCYNQDLLKDMIATIRRERWFFTRLQEFWYWSKPLRWLKRAFGFARKLSYSKHDKYDQNVNGAFSRADNELFCDWYAVWGFQELDKGIR